MATTTPRIGLTKPDGTDLVDIAVLNTNFDKIDSNIASTKIQSTKPTTANAGDLWWDSDSGTLYVYYTDANSSQWVAATSDPINIGVVANQTERDAQYPTPAQGMKVYRTDLGLTQTYFGLYNVSTNPGGRDTAGWYNTEKTAGLVPIKATTATIVSGTGSANSLGVVSFTNATKVQLDGIFSGNYRHYKIVFSAAQNTSNGGWSFRGITSGTENTSAAYFLQYLEAGSTTYVGNQNGQTSGSISASSAGFTASAEIMVYNPNIATTTQLHSLSLRGEGASTNLSSYMSGISSSAQFTGISLFTSAGTFTGTVQVFGINDK